LADSNERRWPQTLSVTQRSFHTQLSAVHRKFKRSELWQLWRRDPNLVIAKYREAVGDDRGGHPVTTPPPYEMINAIIEHEEAHLTTARMLRSIAA
jgi:hypothetical protein